MHAHFSLPTLKGIWRFAAALTVVSVLGAVIGQADKLVISSSLPLEDLGYYTLAMTAVGPLPHIAAAVAAAALPRFTAELATSRFESVRRTYAHALHAVAFATLWTALPLMFFSNELLSLWTGSETVAASTDAVLTLLSIAYVLNALAALPYTLALAGGYSGIALKVNAWSAPVVIGLTFVLVPSLGIVGAAGLWLALMAAYLCAYAVFVHRLLLPGAFRRFVQQMAPYGTGGVVIFAVARLLASYADTEIISYAIAVAAMVAYGFMGARLLPADVREAALSFVRRMGEAPAHATERSP
jgi:O-antigen/teichoic acid export membrane protein